MFNFLLGWSLKHFHFATLRIKTRHHIFDHRVFARTVHRLKNDQQRLAVLRIKHVLQLSQPLYICFQIFDGICERHPSWPSMASRSHGR